MSGAFTFHNQHVLVPHLCGTSKCYRCVDCQRTGRIREFEGEPCPSSVRQGSLWTYSQAVQRLP